MTPIADPPGRKRHCRGDVGIYLELDTRSVRLVLSPGRSLRIADPDQLDDLARRIAVAAGILRCYVERGDLPLLGGQLDPWNDQQWWQD